MSYPAGTFICGHCDAFVLPPSSHSCVAMRRAMCGNRRWPAIEPHWRVLYREGQISFECPSRESALAFARIHRLQPIPIAIIKVTPK